MRLALVYGKRHLGKTWPNPCVGCILVKENRIVGRGVTGIGGRPHAEAIAVARAGEAAKGSTAYVTLEPCSHYGLTDPCAKLLIEAEISRAVVTLKDPNPKIAGRGIKMLQNAGIDVRSGVLESEAKYAHRGFLSTITTGLPSITLKLAMSFDGKIATQIKDSKWITEPAARRYVHLLRNQHDAVMVGRGTACTDNPDLSPKDIATDQLPIRVVMDTNLKTPVNSQLGMAAIRQEPVWFCYGKTAPNKNADQWRKQRANTICCDITNGRIDLQDACGKLAKQGLTRIFCEGGSTLATSLIEHNIVDEIIGFTSGLLLGAESLSPFAQLGVEEVKDASNFLLKSTKRIGGNVMHSWTRQDHNNE